MQQAHVSGILLLSDPNFSSPRTWSGSYVRYLIFAMCVSVHIYVCRVSCNWHWNYQESMFIKQRKQRWGCICWSDENGDFILEQETHLGPLVASLDFCPNVRYSCNQSVQVTSKCWKFAFFVALITIKKNYNKNILLWIISISRVGLNFQFIVLLFLWPHCTWGLFSWSFSSVAFNFVALKFDCIWQSSFWDEVIFCFCLK